MSELALSGIVVAAILYALGSRGARGGRSQREGSRRATAFYCGLAALALAIAPPLDDQADRLFWAHMVQHGLLQMIGPALIVLGAPWLVICRPFSLGGRRRTGRWLVQSRSAAPLRAVARVLTLPAVAWALFLGAIWLSHLPAIFDYALGHPAFHESEHIVFVATGLLFWTRVFDSPPFHARLTHVRRFGYLLAAGVAEAALSVVILAAHAPLYAPYERILPRPEHLTALADQQLGGLMMLEPASLPLLLATLWSLGTLVAPAAKRRRAQAAA